MIYRTAFVADDLPADDYDPPPLPEGRYWSSNGGDASYPAVTRPIGFMRCKPRVRVKAWTAPIVEDVAR